MKKKKTEKLKLLDDLPFNLENGKDLLSYEPYVKILKETFEALSAGSSVGFFGKWGQGKSSVVNMLNNKPPEATKVVIFNAWQSQGNSVRRQMLLSLADGLNSSKLKDLKKFFGLKATFTPHSDKCQPGIPWKDLWDDIKKDCVLRWSLILSIGLFLASILSFWKASVFPDRETYYLAWATSFFFPSLVPVAALLVSKWSKKYTIELRSGQQGSDSLRLKYPEQFQDEFKDQVSSYLNNHKEYRRVLLVVDDLDRCDCNTVTEALAAIRQFAAKDGNAVDCQFLLPCDEKQVALALESAGHDAGREGARYHDYRNEELLRKFFDVVVRMDAPLHQDMVGYAEKLVNENELALPLPDARELIALAGARDPREVKKLLNSLIIAKAKLQHSIDLLPKDATMLDQLSETVRFLVVLREKYPVAYEALGKDPSLLRSKFELPEEKKEDPWFVSQCKAAQNLLNLQPIPIPTANILLYGRLDEQIREVGAAGWLMQAIQDDRPNALTEVMKKVTEDEIGAVTKWLAGKSRQVKALADARRMLLHVLDYGYEKAEEGIPLVEDCIRSLLSARSIKMANVIEGVGDIQGLRDVLPRIDRDIAAKILSATYEAFARKEFKDDALLNVLLNTARLSDVPTREKMCEWMIDQIRTDNGIPGFVLRLEKQLDLDSKAYLSGVFPKVAQVMSELTDWGLGDEALENESPSGNPVGTLLLMFVGDKPMKAECTDVLLKNQDLLDNSMPTRGHHKQEVERLWETVGSLLQRVDEIRAEWAEILRNWMRKREDASEIGMFLKGIWPIMPRIPNGERGKFVSIIVEKCIRGSVDETVLVIPSKKTLDEESKEEWQALLCELVEEITSYGQPARDLGPKDIHLLEEIVKADWYCDEEADEALAKTVKADKSNRDWTDVLVALGRRFSRTEEAIRDSVVDNRMIELNVELGLKTAWKTEIGVASANSLGVALVQHWRDFTNKHVEELFQRKKADQIIDTGIKELRKEKYDSDWLHNDDDLLCLLAEKLEEYKKIELVAEFSEVLAKLSHSPSWEHVHTAAKVARRLPRVSPALHTRLSSYFKENRERWRSEEFKQVFDDFKAACSVKTIDERDNHQ